MAKSIDEFIRQCYLKSTPSIDLNDVPKGEQIAPWDHKLDYEEYCALVEEYSEGNAEVKGAMNIWCLNSGPSIVNCQTH